MIPNSWNVPHWLNKDEYAPPSGSVEKLYWAWQFLRRNPEYRNFWVNRVVELGLGDPWRDAIDGVSCHYAGGIWEDAIDEASSRFGLALPHNPAERQGAYFATAGTTIIKGAYEQKEPHDVVFKFDLRLPLDAQFKRALQSAKTRQRQLSSDGRINFKDTRDRTDKYVIYLQIIDAIDDGQEHGHIAGCLFSDIPNDYPEYYRLKTLNNHINAAMRLRDIDFKLLSSNYTSEKMAPK